MKKLLQNITLNKYKKTASSVIEESFNLSDNTTSELVSWLHQKDIDPNYILSISIELSRRYLGLDAYHEQVVGALATYDGYVIDMKTGEGKTLVAILSSIMMSFVYDVVRVATANDYLADRDYLIAKPLFDEIGVPLVSHPESIDKGVIYGTLNDFCLQWLSDNLVKERSEINQKDLFSDKKSALIVDEIDLSLISASTTPFAIVRSIDIFDDSSNFISLAEKIKEQEDLSAPYIEDEQKMIFSECFYKNFESIAVSEFGITKESCFSENFGLLVALKDAYIAMYVLELDKDYLIKDGHIYRINKSTGRAVRSGFGEGVNKYISIKEGIDIERPRLDMITATIPNYVKKYHSISGMSGSAMANKLELKHVYNLSTIEVPLRFPVTRVDEGYFLFESKVKKIEKALDVISSWVKYSAPVLVVCENDYEARNVFSTLKSIEDIKGAEINLLVSANEDEESEILKSSGEVGSVTVTTRMCGRGTDIKVSEDANDLGGLHILATSAGETFVNDLQLIGRSGRQGDNGRTMILVSMEDDILRAKATSNRAVNTIMMQMVYSENSDKKDEARKQKNITRIIRKTQNAKQNTQKEARKVLSLFNKPLITQLDIFNKKRFEIIDCEDFLSYTMDTIKSLNTHDGEAASEAINVWAKSYGVEVFNKIAKESFLNSLIMVWATHNTEMANLKNESIASCCGSNSGINGFLLKSQSAFEKIVKEVNFQLINNLMTDIKKETNFIESTKNLLSSTDLNELYSS